VDFSYHGFLPPNRRVPRRTFADFASPLSFCLRFRSESKLLFAAEHLISVLLCRSQAASLGKPDSYNKIYSRNREREREKERERERERERQRRGTYSIRSFDIEIFGNSDVELLNFANPKTLRFFLPPPPPHIFRFAHIRPFMELPTHDNSCGSEFDGNGGTKREKQKAEKRERKRERERKRKERKNTLRHRDEKEVRTNPDRRGSTRARRSPSLSASSVPFLLIAPTGVAAEPLISFNRLLFFSLPTGELQFSRRRAISEGKKPPESLRRALGHATTFREKVSRNSVA